MAPSFLRLLRLFAAKPGPRPFPDPERGFTEEDEDGGGDRDGSEATAGRIKAKMDPKMNCLCDPLPSAFVDAGFVANVPSSRSLERLLKHGVSVPFQLLQADH